MRTVLFFSFLLISGTFIAQNSFSMDDYFNANNPSAFAEKKLYLSNTSMYSRFGMIPNYFNFFSLKQQVGSFSLGFNNGFSQWSDWKVVSNTINAAYSFKINRNLTLNLGLGLNSRRDNMTFIDSTTPPIDYYTLWNPTSYNVNMGISLVSKKWTFGLAANNLNRAEIRNYPYSYQSPVTIATNASYRFDLDSAKHFSLTPSLFYRRDVDNNFDDFFFNLTFKAYQHRTGFFSTLNHNIGIFYQYNFKNNLSIGASISNNYSLLSSNMFETNYLSGMLRLSYAFSQIIIRTCGATSF